MSTKNRRVSYLLMFVVLTGIVGSEVAAQRGARGGAGAQGRSTAGTAVKGKRTHHGSTHHAGTGTTASRTTNTNRNVNVNNNVNVNGNGYGYGYGAHPVARGVVAGATAAAVMGSYHASLPSGCATVMHGGVAYNQCGSTWYRSEGGQYVVVPAP
jgi:hypothetical protein